MTARNQDGKFMLAFCIFGILMFTFLALFGIRNMIKFKNSISFSMYLFYGIALLVAVTRILYYFGQLFWTDERLRVIFSVLPGAFLLGVMTAQLNIYIQLMLRLQSLIDCPRGTIVEDSPEERALKKKEKISLVLCVLLISFYPVLFSTQISINYLRDI